MLFCFAFFAFFFLFASQPTFQASTFFYHFILFSLSLSHTHTHTQRESRHVTTSASPPKYKSKVPIFVHIINTPFVDPPLFCLEELFRGRERKSVCCVVLREREREREREMGNSFGCSASGERLVSAARDGDLVEAKMLLECNPCLAKYSTFGGLNSPLHFAASKGHNEVPTFHV